MAFPWLVAAVLLATVSSLDAKNVVGIAVDTSTGMSCHAGTHAVTAAWR